MGSARRFDHGVEQPFARRGGGVSFTADQQELVAVASQIPIPIDGLTQTSQERYSNPQASITCKASGRWQLTAQR